MLERQPQTRLAHRLAREPGLASPDRAAGHVVGAQHIQPVGARFAKEDRFQQVAGGQHVSLQRVERVAQANSLQRLAVEVGEQGAQEEPLPVCRLIQPIAGVRSWRDAARQRLHAVDADRRTDLARAMQAADGHRLAPAAAAALQQRRADGGGAQHRLGGVGDGQNIVRRLIAPRPLPKGHAGQADQQAVVAGQFAPGPACPIGRQPGVDQGGMSRGERCAVQAARGQAHGRMIEDRHIGARHQRGGGLAVGGNLDVQGQHLFVAVPGQIAGIILEAVAGRRLDLDHLGREIGEQHGGHRPDHPLAEIDDAHAAIGGHLYGLPWLAAACVPRLTPKT